MTTFDNPEGQWWRHFDNPDDYWWRNFDNPATTHDYLVTTPHDVSDDPCYDIDDQEQLAKYVERLMVGALSGDAKDDKVMTMTTSVPKWWHCEPCKTTDVTTTDNTWW
jgi:hypothetical protein